jgi:hypothetical protein
MTAKTSPASAAQAVSQVGFALPEGFDAVGLDRFMYNPNKGCKGPLRGFLLSVVAMPPMERGKDPKTKEPIMQDWDCLLVKTTAPTQGIDREGKVVDVPSGREVLTPKTFRLGDTFERAALDPDFCYEVFIAPDKKIDIGSGQTMWLYNMGANKKGTPRAEFGIVARLGNSTAKALPASTGGAQAAEAVADVATPF